jgi:hypothetical protein
MQVSYYCEPSPARAHPSENEDYVVAGPDWAFVLDGATPQPQFAIGCIHGVAWYARQLAGAFASLLAQSDAPLPDLLSEAISTVCLAHADTCDLSNRASPSSTVTAVRQRAGGLEYLVLADSPLVLETTSGIDVIFDNPNDLLPDFQPETVEACRNQVGGY